MKTNELIKHLLAEDPSGELEVVVGCEDIYHLEKQVMYYDGLPTLLVREPKLAPYYDVVGLHIPASSGEKVRIITMNASAVFIDDPDMPVTYGNDYARNSRENMIENSRAEMKAANLQIEDEERIFKTKISESITPAK